MKRTNILAPVLLALAAAGFNCNAQDLKINDLEYADSLTLGRSILNRTVFKP